MRSCHDNADKADNIRSAYTRTTINVLFVIFDCRRQDGSDSFWASSIEIPKPLSSIYYWSNKRLKSIDIYSWQFLLIINYQKSQAHIVLLYRNGYKFEFKYWQIDSSKSGLNERGCILIGTNRLTGYICETRTRCLSRSGLRWQTDIHC